MTDQTRAKADQIRKGMEDRGYKLSQPEFEAVMRYTIRKIEVIGKDENYISFLLEDEIKNYIFRNTVNAASLQMMALI